MVDGVVLHALEQIALVVHLEHEVSGVGDERGDAVDQRVQIVDVREDVVRHHQRGGALFFANLLGDVATEVRALERPALFLAGAQRDIRRVDADDRWPPRR